MCRLKHFGIVLFFASIGITYGQNATPVTQTNPCISQQCYVAIQSASLSASASTTLTIQQPASGARQITFSAGIAQCPGQSFTVDQSQNGTAATATAGSAVPLLPLHVTAAGTGPVVAATATVWTASNVGSGTTVAPTLTYTGGLAVVDLSARTIATSGTANNYSIKLTNTGSASCTGSIAIYWAEKF